MLLKTVVLGANYCPSRGGGGEVEMSVKPFIQSILTIEKYLRFRKVYFVLPVFSCVSPS